MLRRLRLQTSNASVQDKLAPLLAVKRTGFRIRAMPTIPLTLAMFIVFVAIFAPLLAPIDPNYASLRNNMTPPAFMEGGSSAYLLGTDYQGRDVLSRLIYGSRIALAVSASVLTISTSVGVTLGLLAGYKGGIWDILIMRLVDIVLAFPALLIAIVFAVTYGPSFFNVVIIIASLYWAGVARYVRAETLALKAQDFVTLARVAGASNIRIMFKHILPNVIPTILVLVTLEVGSVIIFEASLSFLGVGVPPPNPSWGSMVSEGRDVLVSAWWISVFAGGCIMVTVLAMNSLGDWLRDRLDPRLRNV